VTEVGKKGFRDSCYAGVKRAAKQKHATKGTALWHGGDLTAKRPRGCKRQDVNGSLRKGKLPNQKDFELGLPQAEKTSNWEEKTTQNKRLWRGQKRGQNCKRTRVRKENPKGLGSPLNWGGGPLET